MHSLVVGSSSRSLVPCDGGASLLPLAQPEVRAALPRSRPGRHPCLRSSFQDYGAKCFLSSLCCGEQSLLQ